MRAPGLRASLQVHPAFRRRTRSWTAVLLLAVLPAALPAAAAGFPAQASAGPAIPAESPSPGAIPAAAPLKSDKPGPETQLAKPVRNSSRRRAAKIYFAASKLFAKGQFEAAMRGYERAAALDPGNPDYPLAESVARSHAVAALIQSAASDRLKGDQAAARAALALALQLAPHDAEVNEHLDALGDDALRGQPRPIYEQGAETAGPALALTPEAATRSFHLRADQRQIIQYVFAAYGIEASVDPSVSALPARLDVDRVNFATAAHLVELATDSFYVPLDAHHALVARDTRENRLRFTPQDLETVYLSGLTATELTEVVNLAKNVFNMQTAAADAASGTITLRAPQRTLNAFNATMSDLLDGKSQTLLDVRVIQLAHSNERNTGVQPLQTVTAFNVYSEEESILNANSALVQEIISSGLAASGDNLAILGILLASGQISSSLFSNGIALFGGGITQSALSPGGVALNLDLNSSKSRELDRIQLRLGDGEEGTMLMGERYPIQTATYSSLASSSTSIPGLTTAGTSSALSSLLSSLSSSAANLPQVEYENLGLTLKATPKVLRNDEVALSLDMKLDSLSGTFLNGNPVLDDRAWSGVVTVKQNEAVVVASEMDKSESRAVSGTPGLSEIPGMENLTDKDVQVNESTLLIVITARVVRGTQAAGRSPMMLVERGAEQH